MDFTIVNKTVCIIAKRNSGKSVLIKYIVGQYKQNFDKIFLISPTEKINNFFTKDNFIDSKCVYDEYNEDFINSLMKRMEIVNKGFTEGIDNDKSKKVLLILDDCCSDSIFHQSKSLKQLFTRGRHLHISIILTQQSPNQVPPVCRINSDFIITGNLNDEGKEKIIQYYKKNMNRDEFEKMFNLNTENYGFLIINGNSTKTNNLNEIYANIKTPNNLI